jgi:TetR/AcrR family transcriptional regulator, cholesterol catabolism regulator
MRELPSEHKRAKIVDAACSLFTSLGYEATSVNMVAAHAHVAPNTIYWYFDNKDALLLAVLDRLVADARAQYTDMLERGLAFDVRMNWLIDQFAGLGGLVGAVHGRISVSERVRAWHDEFHRLASEFFVQGLMNRGAKREQAEAVVAIAFFLLEGLALHPVSPQSRATSIQFLGQAIQSALNQMAGAPESQLANSA